MNIEVHKTTAVFFAHETAPQYLLKGNAIVSSITIEQNMKGSEWIVQVSIITHHCTFDY